MRPAVLGCGNVHCGLWRVGYARVMWDILGYSGIFWDIWGLMFFPKDPPQTEGRRDAHHKIKTVPGLEPCVCTRWAHVLLDGYLAELHVVRDEKAE